jgi:exosortase
MTTIQKHQAAFAALWAASLLLFWRPLLDTFSLSIGDDEYTHILLILPVSAVFAFMMPQLLRNTGEWNFRLALAFLAPAAVITVYALYATSLSSDVRLSAFMLAVVFLWIGFFMLCFGVRAFLSSLFPLIFLFGLVPLPKNVLNFIITLLQEGSAWSAHVLFATFGVPVVQQGNLITIPGLTIQVAQECSSIRSSSMLLVTTVVLVQIFLRSSWRKFLVVGCVIPLSVAKNGLRIFTLTMLGTRVDPSYLRGRLHHQGGIIFFIIALMGIFALLAVCQKGENAPLKTGMEPAELKASGAR